MFVFLNVYALNRPEIMIANAADKFDKDGNLTDSPTRENKGIHIEELRAIRDSIGSTPWCCLLSEVRQF
jgi:hypothetical protein